MQELESAVVKTFQVTGINIGRRNFHAVHRLVNQRIVITKHTNILRQKKKLVTLSADEIVENLCK